MIDTVVRASPLGRPLLAVAALAAPGIAGAIAVTHASPWLYLVAPLPLVAVVALGVFSLASGVFARPILAGPATPHHLALTFDDGPDPRTTRAVLDALEARGHRGTFFVVGQRAAEHADLVAEIARRGHGLANHSHAHAYDTTFRPVDDLAAELARAQELLDRAEPSRKHRWFRPPVGLLSPRVAAAAERAGLAIVGWTANARDGVAATTVEQALARLAPHLRPGAILVLHDAAWQPDRVPIAPALVEKVLELCEERGLRSVTLDELLLGEGDRGTGS